MPLVRFRLLLASTGLAVFASSFFTLAPQPAEAQSMVAASLAPSTETSAAIRQLIGDSILNGKAYDYDRELADTYGPRLTGSANYMRAADWAVQQFRSMGLSNVHTEDWTIPATWEPEVAAVGYVTAPVDHTLHIYSIGWSPSTPKGGISGDVVYVPSLTAEELDKLQAKLKGTVALVDE